MLYISDFNPLEKNDTWKQIQSSTTEKVPNCANLPLGKIEKIIIKGSPGFLHLYACGDKNGIVHSVDESLSC